jgi:hypothetical protein
VGPGGAQGWGAEYSEYGALSRHVAGDAPGEARAELRSTARRWQRRLRHAAAAVLAAGASLIAPTGAYAWHLEGHVVCGVTDLSLAGATVTVQGITSTGESVFRSGVSGGNGAYEFALPDMPGGFDASVDFTAVGGGSIMAPQRLVHFETTEQYPVAAIDWLVSSAGCAELMCGQAPSPVEPHITSQPMSRFVTVGDSVLFTVSATGSPTLSYQWQRNGVDIADTNGDYYYLDSALMSDNGAVFRCVVTNGAGSASSNEATLSVIGITGNFIPDPGFEGGTAALDVATQYGDSLTRVTESPIAGQASGRLVIGSYNLAGYSKYLGGPAESLSAMTVEADIRPEYIPEGGSLRLCASAYQGSDYIDQCTSVGPDVGVTSHYTVTMPLNPENLTNRVNLILFGSDSSGPQAIYLIDNLSLTTTLVTP